ncbi:DUF1488 domain-containing protein [Vibrio sp. 10N.261.55.A7]|uniref:DUF1488 domain-containing protein n=1 Tax=Vibrio sp. 10N.261.55.A7 TaxID=1880851 RepID=UPI000C824E82|nr:DUF1488 domain-containing protein [Vibrio sp. 10N.261.55.A7]PMJ91948.1 transcriptional regulator [Vibrio sp. 10N.261.55.A7]
MNQSILFPDLQSWNDEKQHVEFAAQQFGALIECRVSKSYLESLAAVEIRTTEQALDVFSQFRFDIEEQIEERIEEEEFNSLGQVEL